HLSSWLGQRFRACSCLVVSSWYVRAHCVSSFFFSGRRRHTRSKRDWSSDVCSSDLDLPNSHHAKSGDSFSTSPRYPQSHQVENRSEERRVGKESRSRGWPAQ